MTEHRINRTKEAEGMENMRERFGCRILAWSKLRPMIQSIHAGHAVTMISCCTDGLRPVTFKLERVELE